MNILRKNDGLSLLDLLAAMVITVIIVGLASSLFLTGTNLSGEILESAQAYRNGQVAIMHLEKYTCNAASEFGAGSGSSVLPWGGTVDYLEYNIYDSPPDIINGPSITSRYEFSGTTLLYFPDITDTSTVVIVSDHINSCDYNFNTTTGDNIVVEIEIEALDNNDNLNSAYTLATMIRATANDSNV